MVKYKILSGTPKTGLKQKEIEGYKLKGDYGAHKEGPKNWVLDDFPTGVAVQKGLKTLQECIETIAAVDNAVTAAKCGSYYKQIVDSMEKNNLPFNK